MVGDDKIYDVVVIEYVLDWVSSALDVLAERLRKRFPDATFIFLDVWAPRQYYHKPTQKTLNTLVHEKMRSAIVTEQDIHQWLDATNSEDWGFEPYNSKVIEDAARKVGGHIVTLPSHPDPIIAIKTYSPLYVLN
jgi:ubiquinone/menaquinone biosynthesis C-methylase UbiE